MTYRRKLGRGAEALGRAAATVLSIVCVLSASANAQLGLSDVLILANRNSPTSVYITKLYRRYYPQITASQVLYLSGLPDCSGPNSTPADEVITRQQYNDLIANPVRNYLTDPCYPDRITRVKLIITTAGMPYRIRDTVFADAVYPAGSNYNTIINQESSIDAASVESELTCLWYCDYDSNSFGRTNRMVNPYQGYRSSVTAFPRALPGSKQMHWTIAISLLAPLVENPRMEGTLPPPSRGTYYYGTINRNFNVGDMYLTARLDGPKAQGKSAVFAVHDLLERAKRASSSRYGVNPAKAVAVLDDAPTITGNFDKNRTFNLTAGVNYWVYDPCTRQPPNADQVRVVEDYISAYTQTTGLTPSNGILNIGNFPPVNLPVMLDRRNYTRTTQTDLDNYAFQDPCRVNPQGVVFLATYGKNGDEGNPPNYLLTSGPGGGPLFNVVNGAVFTSLESFNAVTMFADVNTAPVAQGKLINFIDIGGCAALGHSFEPQPDAAIDNEFFLYNLLADSNGDGRAELTLVEAAFSALPYLSWSEVLIGDPLMRITYGPDFNSAWTPPQGDTNCDGIVNTKDFYAFARSFYGKLESVDPNNPDVYEVYDDMCDFNEDGIVNTTDWPVLRAALTGQ